MSQNIEALDQNKTNGEALNWVLEMELVSDPNFINAILLNIFKITPRIKDVEIISDSVNKKMLVWLKLDWWGRKFNQVKIQETVDSMLNQALPSYKFRVIYNRELFEKALDISRKLNHVGQANSKKSTTRRS